MADLTLTFYDTIAIVLPGTLTLVGISVLFDVGPLRPLLIPQDGGALVAHVLLAYLAGQLLQAIGNGLEAVYWSFWRGKPTAWPLSRPKSNSFPSAVQTVSDLLNLKPPDPQQADAAVTWRHMLSAARAAIYADGLAGRLQVFNSTYGMLRGVLAAFLVLAGIGWASPTFQPLYYYLFILLLASLATFRMHHFALLYATEFFSTIRLLREKRKAPRTRRADK